MANITDNVYITHLITNDIFISLHGNILNNSDKNDICYNCILSYCRKLHTFNAKEKVIDGLVFCILFTAHITSIRDLNLIINSIMHMVQNINLLLVFRVLNRDITIGHFFQNWNLNFNSANILIKLFKQ
jgi:hypothetical protein